MFTFVGRIIADIAGHSLASARHDAYAGSQVKYILVWKMKSCWLSFSSSFFSTLINRNINILWIQSRTHIAPQEVKRFTLFDAESLFFFHYQMDESY